MTATLPGLTGLASDDAHVTDVTEVAAGEVGIRRLSPLYGAPGRPVPRLELCPPGGESVQFTACDLGVALEMSGAPLRVAMWRDPQLLARLALQGLVNVGRARLVELDARTRTAALDGDDAAYCRVTQGRDPGLASMLKCELFAHADRLAGEVD